VSGKTRVLIVDDSAIVRKLLTEALSAERDIEVVGTAPDPYVARDKILTLKPDVLTLDIEMPRMDGVTFLRKLMRYHPMPVIVISSLGEASCEAAVTALREGAVEVIAKPGGPYSVGDLRIGLPAKVRAAARAQVRLREASEPLPARPAKAHPRPVDERTLIAIGASTGGMEAIEAVLTRLPARVPPIAVVQHIPAGFSRAFAERLNRVCEFEVREAADGDALTPGLALVAPGNYHMLVNRAGSEYRVTIKDGPLVCYQRPSVDVMFHSAAKAAGAHGVGVILTGMGSDGAQGLLAMKQAGAATIAQDEQTSVVFGMPREAIRLGAADRVLPLARVASGIMAAIEKPVAARA